MFATELGQILSYLVFLLSYHLLNTSVQYRANKIQQKNTINKVYFVYCTLLNRIQNVGNFALKIIVNYKEYRATIALNKDTRLIPMELEELISKVLHKVSLHDLHTILEALG